MRRKLFIAAGALVAVIALGAAIVLASGGDEAAPPSAESPPTATATPEPTGTTPPPTATVPPAATPTAATGGGSPPSTPSLPVATRVPPTQPPVQPTIAPAPIPPSAPGISTPPAGTVLQPAPIDGLEVVVRESFPPQYAVAIKAGLPSGCARAAGYSVSRSGNVFTLVVMNSNAAGGVACTLIYGMYDINASLGSDFVSGQTYTVEVNDKSISFVAQ